MTHGECLAIVTGLVAAYPREMGEQTVQVYVDDLRDCDPVPLMRAVVALRRTSKWLPTIAEIRQAVAKERLPHALESGEAWSQAVGLMSSIGSYGMLSDAGSPYVNRALRLCGRWEDICQEDMTWLRKRFVEVYDQLVTDARETLQITGEPPPWLEHHTVPSLNGPSDDYRALLGKLGEHFTAPE